MKIAILVCLPMLPALLLAGCSDPATPPAPRAERPPAADVIGAPLHQSLDKAHAVEELGGQHKSGIDDAVDDAN